MEPYIDAALQWRPLLIHLYSWRLISQMTCVAAFFAILGFKSGTEKVPDSRRRLRILRIGASIGLTPTFLIIVYSLVRGTDIFDGIPWPLEVTALCMLALFPITLAYVIIVERAMDLRVVLRQGVKYGLARGGLWLVRTMLIVFAVYVFSVACEPERTALGGWLRRGGAGDNQAQEHGKGIGVARPQIFPRSLQRRNRSQRTGCRSGPLCRDRPSARKGRAANFRYASCAGHRNPGARRQRIQNALFHAPRRANGIPAGSHLLAAPDEHEAPLQVYFDKPQPWIRALNAEELQTLDFMRSEVLLALRGRGSQGGRIIGIMSLGPKKSEEPYSKTDVRLLQAIAVQMGWRSKTAALPPRWRTEAAHREVMNREIEIAREVQERLFPQKFPKIAGIDCWGYCRPARGVGGDYYDFIELPDGRLGIAIGDVSGKGIAAALLMASLQASLRGQTMAGVNDLAALMVNVNKLVYDASQSNRYATFFYARVRSAHQPAFLRQCRPQSAGDSPRREILRLEASGPVVGLLPAVGYAMELCQLLPGDIFVGYTDGISEAMNEQDEEWDEERFIAAAHAVANEAVEGHDRGYFPACRCFTGAARQYDDMTLLAMKLRHNPHFPENAHLVSLQ